jgi:hypothetical protein
MKKQLSLVSFREEFEKACSSSPDEKYTMGRAMNYGNLHLAMLALGIERVMKVNIPCE